MNCHFLPLPFILCLIFKFIDAETFEFGDKILSLKKFSNDDVLVLLLSNGTIYLIDSNTFDRIFDSKFLNVGHLNGAYIHIVGGFYGVLICSNEFSNGQCYYLPVSNKTFGNVRCLKLFDHKFDSLTMASSPIFGLNLKPNVDADLFYAYTWKTNINGNFHNSTVVRKVLNQDEFDEAFDGKDLVKSSQAKNPSISNVYEFTYDNYVYFLRNTFQKNHTAGGPYINERFIKLTRICLNDRKSKNLRSLASLPLSFGSKNENLLNNSKASAAFFDSSREKLFVLVDDLTNEKLDSFLFVYDMKLVAETFVSDFNDCYTSSSAWHVAILEPESPPSLCPLYEMFDELHKPCNFDICSPIFCTHDARFYVESYRPVDGSVVLTFRKTFLSSGTIDNFQISDDFLYLSSSGNRFLLANLNETINNSLVFTNRLINSAHRQNFVINKDQSFILANGSNLVKYSIGCSLFKNCDEILLARRMKKFSTCGWCTNYENEAGFGATSDVCIKNSGIFLTEKCPPEVGCFVPSVLNTKNSTEVTIYGRFPNDTDVWSVSVCGSLCLIKNYDQNSLVCETAPPFSAVAKDCTAFVDGWLNDAKFRIRSSCEYRFADDESSLRAANFSHRLPTWAAALLFFVGLIFCFMIVLVVRRLFCTKDKVRPNGDSPWYHMVPLREQVNRYGPSPGRQMVQQNTQYGSVPYEDFSFLIPNEIRIPWSSINKQELIGAGHFGEVYKAFYRKPDGILNVVAVKTLPVGARNVRQFIEEGIRMEVFDHKNVLSLIGITFSESNLPMIVTPFMSNGDLLSYIRNENNHPTVRQLLYLAVDIAEGLNYLHQLKFIHRDLAARNCMLDESLHVKVADFGLSRDVYETEFYLSVRTDADIPIKWLPLESIERREFTSKSDMWSFGITLWEITTRGVEPYAGMSGYQTLEFLKSGRRLEKPAYCPEEIYELISICWLINPRDRPDADEMCVRLPATIRMLEVNSPSYYNMTAPLRTSSQIETVL